MFHAAHSSDQYDDDFYGPCPNNENKNIVYYNEQKL